MVTNPNYLIAAALIASLQRLRDLHPDMTLMQLQSLLLVARDPGVKQRELIRSIDTVDSTASRTIGLLSEHGSRRIHGLNLVRMEVNAGDRRERNCFLTTAGESLLKDIVQDFKRVSDSTAMAGAAI